MMTLLIYMILVIIEFILYHVAKKQKTFADPVFDRIDNLIPQGLPDQP